MKETEYEKSMRLWKIKYKKILKQEKASKELLRNSDHFIYWLRRFMLVEKETRVLPKRINKTKYYRRIYKIIYTWAVGYNMSYIARQYKYSRSRIQQIINRFWHYVEKRRAIEQGKERSKG